MDDRGPIRVLLISASPIQREFAPRILALAGDMEPAVAIDGREGLELARSFRPHVMVLDAVLPVISGIELLRRYRAENGPARALVTTSSGSPSVRAAVFAAGADFVLLLPAQWGELLHHIRFFANGFLSPCRALLREMGAPSGWVGTEQAAICAGILAERGSVLLKEAYLEAAARTCTGLDCVEVNIRRVIRAIHRENAPSYRALGLPLGDKPPANKDFLLALSRAVRIPL